MNFLVFIPARGGSKRIPKKNIFPINGKPLIKYLFEKIVELGWEKNTYVSSDMEEIRSIAIKHKINFVERPKLLCKDDSPTESALIHTLSKVNNEYEFVITLPPTSPLLKSSSILKAVEYFKSNYKNIDSLISVHETKDDIWHYENNFFKRVFPEEPRRQQDRKPLFVENSAIYITKISSLLKTKSILGETSIPFKITKDEGLDINLKEDIKNVEFYLGKES